jgi:hypothetical protein
MNFNPFDIAIIVVTVVLLVIAGTMGAFDHWSLDDLTHPTSSLET